jgi:hypothetical protein
MEISFPHRRDFHLCVRPTVLCVDASWTDANKSMVPSKRLVHRTVSQPLSLACVLSWPTAAHREEIIVVNRVLRDDPSKSDMHNRQALTLKMIWQAVRDWRMWPLYILGMTHLRK